MLHLFFLTLLLNYKYANKRIDLNKHYEITWHILEDGWLEVQPLGDQGGGYGPGLVP